MDFAETVRTKRKELGWTQRELARRAGISTPYVSLIERKQPHGISGASPTPTVQVVDSIARALGWDVNEARVAAGYAPDDTSIIANDERLAMIDFLFPGLPEPDKTKIDLLIELLDEAVKKVVQEKLDVHPTDSLTALEKLE